MHRLTLTALAVALPLALLVSPLPADDKEDSVKKELKALEGDYELVAIIRDGKEQANPEEKKARLTVKGDGFTLGPDGKDQLKGTLKLDPAKSPKALDIAVEGVTKKDMPLLGVYELKGDELKVCMVEPGKDRPADFTAKEGSDRIIHVYKRVKK